MIRPFRGRTTIHRPPPWWRRVSLEDAVVFSLPPLLLLAYLLAASVADYHESLQFDDWWSRDRHVEEFFTARVSHALRLPKAASLTLRLDPEADDPGVIRIRVPRDVWTEVEEHPLVGWGRWLDATLITPEGSMPVDLRKRGDTSLHWTTGKLSFTLQTRKSEHFHGFREAAVSQKSVLTQYLTNTIPTRFGLLTPFTTVTPVFLNDRYYGVFRFVEEVDEAFLRRHGRMPGNIFRADAAERSEVYKGLPRAVFRNPYIWDRVAENDVPGVAADSALLELIRAVNGTSFEDHLRLMALVDRDEIGRLLGAMLVVGDPYHMSGVHNQFWYEDPSTGLLHPIPWDLRLLDLSARPTRLNEFLRAALRDPFLPDRTLRAVRERMDAGLLDWSRRATERMYARYEPHIEYDRLRRDVIDDPGTPGRILTRLSGNLAILERWMSDARTRFVATPSGHDEIVLDFETAGYAGSDLTGLTVTEAGSPAEARLVADRNRNGVRDPTDPVVPGRWRLEGASLQFEPRDTVPLLAAWSTREEGILPGTMHYRFFLEGLGGGGSGHVPDVRPALRNRITGERSEVLDWEGDAVIPSNTAFSPWRFPGPEEEGELRLAGEVRLTEDLTVPRGSTLRIEPGTRLVLAPDVSIVARGRVLAEGTPDRPIRFLPEDPHLPWGTLALQGPGSDGSRFSDVVFRGGGGATIGRIDYTGMISVHRARDVSFRRVEISDNLRSDDALHALHAEVELTACAFRNTNSDAIDFDYSEGAITGCTFEGSRNDAIDLMTSSPTIRENRIGSSGDKGVSVGEASRPLILDNTIVSCLRGIEVKDGSEPFIAHNTLRGNDVGVLQRVKNWRYGTGGHARLAFNLLEDNGRQVVSDARSRLTAAGDRVVPPDGTVGRDSASLASAEPGAGEDPPPPAVGAWVHRRLGWGAAPEVAGALPSWEGGAPLAARDSLTFVDGFDLDARRWARRGGLRDLHALQRRLVLSARNAPGSARRELRWDLTGSRGAREVVVEASGRGLDSAVVVFHGRGAEVTRSLRTGRHIRSFEWTVVELPPDAYDSLDVRLYPSPGNRRVDPETGLVETGSGRLELRGLWLYVEGGERGEPLPTVPSSTERTR